MLSEIEEFVNWLRRRNPAARTWRDYGYDLHSFVDAVGGHPSARTVHCCCYSLFAAQWGACCRHKSKARAFCPSFLSLYSPGSG